MPARLARALGLLLVAVPIGGCTCRLAMRPALYAQERREVRMSGRELDLCLVRPQQPRSPEALVLLATGDGGWSKTSRAVLQSLADGGYDAAGFSSRAYLRDVKRSGGTISSGRLGQDFSSVLDEAERLLDLPGATPVILAGVSRGAGFAVVAAGQSDLRPRLAGVVAMALTRETDYVRRRHRRRSGREPGAGPERIETYPYLARLGDLPIALIQATRDGYVPADEARRLFGADTAVRRFFEVDAGSHSFRGGRDALRRDARSALDWILRGPGRGEPAAPPTPAPPGAFVPGKAPAGSRPGSGAR